MRLQENIQRIKKIMGLITESELPDGFESVRDITRNFDEDVERLQEFLISKNYDLGSFGPNKDGVDGIYGRLTKRAHKSYLKGLSPEEFNSKEEKSNLSSTNSKNIIIGDSQTPFVDMNTKKAERISKTPGKSSLWEGGKTVSWLISALEIFEVSPDVKNVIIVIGTNGGFGKFLNDDIPTLFKLLREKFPNAKFYAVKGSWGWGGLRKIKESDVNNYYEKFKSQGARIINTPIGNVEPHSNLPVYAQIGKEIDSYL